MLILSTTLLDESLRNKHELLPNFNSFLKMHDSLAVDAPLLEASVGLEPCCGGLQEDMAAKREYIGHDIFQLMLPVRVHDVPKITELIEQIGASRDNLTGEPLCKVDEGNHLEDAINHV